MAINIKNITLGPATLLIIASCSAVFVFGLHLEYSSDTTFALMYRGLFNGVAVPTLGIYELYWGECFAYAYSMWPNIPWHGCVLFILSLLGLVLSLHLFLTLIKKLRVPAHVVLLWSLSFFGLSIVHLICLDFTRIPMIVVASVTIIILTSRPKFLFSLALGIFFLGAYWMRPESGKVVLIILLPLIIAEVVAFRRTRLRSVAIIAAIASLCFSTEFLHGLAYQNRQHKELITMYDQHFAFFDAYHRNEALALDNPADSIRFQAMLIDFQSDMDSLSLEHYRRFVSGVPFSLDAFQDFKPRIERVQQFLCSLAQYQKGFLLCYLTTILCCIIFLRQKRDMLWLLINQLYSWSAVVAIVFFVKAAERTYEPMITVSALVAIADVRRMYKGHNPFALRIAFWPLLLIALVGASHWVKERLAKSRGYAIMEAQNISDVQIIDKWQGQHNNLVFTIDAFELFNMGPFNEYIYSDKKFYIHDAHINYYDIKMNESLDAMSGGKGLLSYYKNIEKNGYIIVSSQKRVELIADYLSIIYKENLSIENVSVLIAGNNEMSEEVGFFRLVKSD